jgi:hypothetical protein
MSNQTRYSQHDDLKHVLAGGLRAYTPPSEAWVHPPLSEAWEPDVFIEKRIMDGERRVDVTFDPRVNCHSCEYAFEVKTTVDDFINSSEQLPDYSRAGYKPVLIVTDSVLKSDRLGESPLDSVKHDAAVVKARIEDSSVFFDTVYACGPSLLTSLLGYLSERSFEMDILGREENAVLRVLADGRANPLLIRKTTPLDGSDVSTALDRLAKVNQIEQVVRGLYRITEKGERELEQ